MEPNLNFNTFVNNSSLLNKFEKCILLLFTLSLWTNISPYYNYSASDIFVWLYTIITGPYSSSFIFRWITIPEKLSRVVTQLFCGGKSVAWRHEQRIRRNHEKGQRKTWSELWEWLREWKTTVIKFCKTRFKKNSSNWIISELKYRSFSRDIITF